MWDIVFHIRFFVGTGEKQGTLFLPEILWIFSENEERFGGDDVRVGVEKKVFNPTHITVSANPFATVAKRVRRTCSVFLGLSFFEEFEGFGFQIGHEVRRNTMVDKFKETKVPASINYFGFGIRVGEIDHRNPREQGCGLACFEKKKLV